MNEIAANEAIGVTEIPDFTSSSDEPSKKLGYSRLDSIESATYADTPWWLLGLGGLLVGGGVYAAKRRAWQNKKNSIEGEMNASLEATPDGDPSQEARSRFNKELLRSVHNIPVESFKIPTFADIRCSSEEQKKIADIVKTLDKHSVFSLIGEQIRLEKLGNEIDSVHSLTFLWAIFHDNELTACMQRIFAASFSKSFHIAGFMQGVNKGMIRYNPRKLDPYLQEWAESLGTTKKAVKPLIDAPFNNEKDWTNLVLHLLSVKKSPEHE